MAEHKNKSRAPIRPLNVATLGISVGGLGFLRPAPGTWGSVPPCGVAALMVLAGSEVLWIHVALGVVLVGASAACVVWGRYAEERFGRKDAAEVVADETAGASMECSSLAGKRLRQPEGDSIAVVNTFLGPDWGLGKRETVSNSLRRFANMTARLAENEGKFDAKIVRSIMDLRIFNEDGTRAENGGATKPTKQDADSTVYQTVFDVKRRLLWMKVPAPDYFADWTHFDLNELWR